jgi:hypothetical protein
MFNVAVKAYKNVQLPKEEAPVINTGGLLSRGTKPKAKNTGKLSPEQRVGKYVAELRKARQGLNNG